MLDKNKFSSIQEGRGRKYHKLEENSVYRKNIFKGLDLVEYAVDEIFPKEDGWYRNTKYLLSTSG